MPIERIHSDKEIITARKKLERHIGIATAGNAAAMLYQIGFGLFLSLNLDSHELRYETKRSAIALASLFRLLMAGTMVNHYTMRWIGLKEIFGTDTLPDTLEELRKDPKYAGSGNTSSSDSLAGITYATVSLLLACALTDADHNSLKVEVPFLVEMISSGIAIVALQLHQEIQLKPAARALIDKILKEVTRLRIAADAIGSANESVNDAAIVGGEGLTQGQENKAKK